MKTYLITLKKEIRVRHKIKAETQKEAIEKAFSRKLKDYIDYIEDDDWLLYDIVEVQG